MFAHSSYSAYLCSDKIPSAARKRKPPQRAAIFVPFQEKGEYRLSSKYDCTAWGSGQRPQRYSHLEALSARSAVF